MSQLLTARALDLKNSYGGVWRYRELLYFLAWRDVKIRYKQTALGVVWAVIQPLFTMLVFTGLFGRLGKLPSDGVPYPVFYLSALLPWIYFSTTLPAASNSLIGNTPLLTKVYFPRVILPVAAAVGGLFDLLIGTTLLAALLAYYHIEPIGALLIWPVCGVLLVIFTVSMGMILASLNVKYRDIKHALPFVIQLWLFVTPVIYPVTMIPERYRFWIALNPLSGLIEGFRGALSPSGQVDWSLIALSAIATTLVFVVGCVYFASSERAFADDV